MIAKRFFWDPSCRGRLHDDKLCAAMTLCPAREAWAGARGSPADAAQEPCGAPREQPHGARAQRAGDGRAAGGVQFGVAHGSLAN